jgi:hypothetical protein
MLSKRRVRRIAVCTVDCLLLSKLLKPESSASELWRSATAEFIADWADVSKKWTFVRKNARNFGFFFVDLFFNGCNGKRAADIVMHCATMQMCCTIRVTRGQRRIGGRLFSVNY